ncbi:MAG: hypothetical protein HUJ75_05265 [Parasporobacterium sp.]|nr:hypothetical protein [Parasporobacterium sp.]
MTGIEIDNIKPVTKALFTGEAFDRLAVLEASFSTLYTVDLDCRVNEKYIEGDEPGEGLYSDGLVLWKTIRPLCFDIIKGKKLPVSFKIIFKIPQSGVANFISKKNLPFRAEDVAGLFINVKYENGKLTCVTGTSLKTFSMDKSLEQAWDEAAAKFINRIQQES